MFVSLGLVLLSGLSLHAVEQQLCSCVRGCTSHAEVRPFSSEEKREGVVASGRWAYVA